MDSIQDTEDTIDASKGVQMKRRKSQRQKVLLAQIRIVTRKNLENMKIRKVMG